MNRINLFHTAPSTLKSVAWGHKSFIKNFTQHFANKNFDATTGTLLFAALLIACSVGVGCSNDKPKSPSSGPQPSTAQTAPSRPSFTPPEEKPVEQAAAKPVHKRIVHKAPMTLTYVDRSSGVSFQYPRKYALKTGEAASELIFSGIIPMDFVQSGGVPLVAVALPDSAYPYSGLTSAYFNVSENKVLTADQCSEFSVPQPDPAAPGNAAIQATAQLATPATSKLPVSRLMIGDMELQSSETSVGGQTGKGPLEETSKYYHVFENGACYEFALKVAIAGTTPTEPAAKAVNRDEVFHQLEKVLATVKFNPVSVADVSPEVKANALPDSVETPAQ